MEALQTGFLRFIRKRGLTREQGEEIWNKCNGQGHFPEEFPVCKDALASSGVDVKRMNEVLEATAVEHE